MGGPVWKRINVVGPLAVNGLNIAGYGQSGPEKSWTVPSLMQGKSLFSYASCLQSKDFVWLSLYPSLFLIHSVFACVA